MKKGYNSYKVSAEAKFIWIMLNRRCGANAETLCKANAESSSLELCGAAANVAQMRSVCELCW